MAAIDVKALLMSYQDVFLILDHFDHADFRISSVTPSGPCQIEHKTLEEAFTTLEKMVAEWHEGSAGLLSCGISSLGLGTGFVADFWRSGIEAMKAPFLLLNRTGENASVILSS